VGKSDQIIFDAYYNVLADTINAQKPMSVAFMGYPDENDFTLRIPGTTRHFYDLKLGNWDINGANVLAIKYDLIICTRCAYFSMQPDMFINSMIEQLTPGGAFLVDWGLGDHYRSSSFKVGWWADGERVIGHGTPLSAICWDPSYENDPAVRRFRSWIAPKGYPGRNLTQVIEDEVPCIATLEELAVQPTSVKFVALWPDSPQLYIIMLFKKVLV
jgi:hypothetical protein